MDARRIIPIGGENPYANHPGFEASNCRLRYTVTPAYMSTSSHGFGCWAGGDHCLPNEERCAKRLASTDFAVTEAWYEGL